MGTEYGITIITGNDESDGMTGDVGDSYWDTDQQAINLKIIGIRGGIILPSLEILKIIIIGVRRITLPMNI